jgi:hypothetical protein
MTLIAVTLRNVATILEEADVYAADQLKDACLDYCTINGEALLENRYVPILNALIVDYWTILSLNSWRILKSESGRSKLSVFLSAEAKYFSMT